ncbi:MAG: transporter substrate-binding domain-containing protein [Deltaproteobacteria bacterium]|jgi:ABC-type amino acid transport substrate-binding protein|nr:transporter substrate-binding domain-containing protein [Deltaproteobacteria bacterium]
MRTVCFALLLLLTAAPVVRAAEEPLRVGMDIPYPPFVYKKPDGTLAGFDVDITRALCAVIKRECVIVAVDFDNLVPFVAQGKLDMVVAGLSATPERAKLVDFTERYYRSHTIFVEKAGAGIDISPGGLAGKRVGTQAGTTQEEFLIRAYPKSILVLRPDFESLMADLQDGKVDAVLIEGLPGFAYLKTPQGSQFEAVGGAVPDPMLSGVFSIAVSKKLPQLTRALNAAIETLRKNGEYARINRNYFDFNIY